MLAEWRRRAPRAYEITFAAVALLAVSIGAAGAALQFASRGAPGIVLAGAGLVLLVAAITLARPLETLRFVFRGTTGGSIYDSLRYRSRVRLVGLLLRASILGTVVLFAAQLPAELGVPFQPLAGDRLLFAAAVLQAVVGLTTLTALYVSLRAHRRTSEAYGLETLAGLPTLAAAALLGLLAALLALRSAGTDAADLSAAAFAVTAGCAVAGIALLRQRGLPGFAAVFAERPDAATGDSARRRSVLAPVLVAFSSLFLVVWLLLYLGIRTTGLASGIPGGLVLVAVVGVTTLTLIGALAVALAKSRPPDETPLFRRKRSREDRRQFAYAIASLVPALLLALGALALRMRGPVAGIPADRSIDVFALALLVGFAPYGFYVASRDRRVRRYEERFPDFLRDIAASRKAGLTLNAAVQIAAKGEYGALTPEIRKMADQLSWNVPFDEALELFGQRVGTPLVQRAILLIQEASRSGGEVTDVLLAAARDAREIKTLENERRRTMTVYTSVIYVSFLVFLGVVAVLLASFLPAGGTELPTMGGGPGASRSDFREFYFLAGLVQAVGNGLAAGVVGNGKVSAGLLHGCAMVAFTFGVFAILIA